MRFSPGDRVHFPGLGTGVVREVRGSDRYALDIKGRLVIARGRDLNPADEPSTRSLRSRSPQEREAVSAGTSGHRTASLDLHGKTSAEAVDLVEAFINDALVNGLAEVAIIHGRSGGRLKTAVHAYLKRLTGLASFRIDPHNAGATIVTFR